MPIRRPLLLVVVPAVLAVGAVLTLPDAAEELFRAGMESMADRKYREAADSFSKLATEHPTATLAPQALLLQARALLLAGNAAAAEAPLDRLLKDFAGSAWLEKARALLADAWRVQKRYADAADLIGSRLTSLRGHDYKVQLASHYVKIADRAFEGEEETDPLKRGQKKRDLDRAFDFYGRARAVLVGEPEEPALLVKRGRAQFEKGNAGGWQAALQVWSEVLRGWPAGPEAAEATYGSGEALRLLGQPLEARRLFQALLQNKAWADTPWAPLALESLAETHLATSGGLERGIALLADFARLYPTHARAPSVLWRAGEALLQGGRPVDAIAAFRLFLERFPKDERAPLAELGVARAFHTLGEFEKAAAAWAEFSVRNPNHGQWAEAQEMIIRSAYDRAVALNTGKKTAEAVAAFRAFLDRYPRHELAPEAQLEIAWIARREKKFADALAEARVVAAKYADRPDPASRAALLAAELLRYDLADLPAAFDAYRAVFERFPGTPAAQTATAAVATMQTKSLQVTVPHVFTTAEKPAIRVETRNLEKLALRAWAIDLREYYEKKQTIGGVEGVEVSIIKAAATWEAPVAEYAKYRDCAADVPLPVKADSGGAWIVSCRAEDLEARVLVLVSDLTLVLKTAPRQALAFCVNARTGEPWPGAEVLLSDGAAIFTRGKTGADGTWKEEWDGPRTDVKAFAAAGGNAAAAERRAGAATAFGYSTKVFLHTDRPLYRPGQTVQLRGIARRATGGLYQTPGGEKVSVRVEDPRGAVPFQAELTTTGFGTFAGSFTLTAEPPLGEYRIVARFAEQDHVGTFRVLEYRKPEFTATLTPVTTAPLRGERVEVKLAARYVFGGPVRGGRVRWAAVPAGWRFDPKNLEEERWFFPEEPVPPTATPEDAAAAQGEGVTDDQGELTIGFDTVEDDGSIAYSVFAEVEDASRHVAQAATTLPVTDRELFAVVKVEKQAYQPGEKVRGTVRIVDASYRPQARSGEALAVRRLPLRGGAAEEVVQRHPVATTADGRAEVTFTLERPGSYVLRFETKERRGAKIAAEAPFVLAGDAEDLAKQARLVAEKEVYVVGDTAQVFVNNPAPGAHALLTFEGERVLEHAVVQLGERSATLPLPVKDSWAPNVWIRIAIPWERKLHEDGDEVTVLKFLKVDVTAEPATAAPGGKVRYTVKTAGPRGEPVSAEVALTVVDAALLSLAGGFGPDVRRFFYDQRRGHSVGTASSVSWSYTGKTIGADRDVLRLEARLKALRQHGTDKPAMERGEFVGLLQDAAKNPAPPQAPAPAAEPAEAGGGGGQAGHYGAGRPSPFTSRRTGYGFARAAGGKAGELRKNGHKDKADEKSRNAPEDAEAAADPAYLDFDLGWGGGAAFEVRERFEDTAAFFPAVVTDAAGTATVEVAMPENLTTWRARALGVDRGSLVGFGDQGVLVKKDLLVRLQLPRFLTGQDRVESAALVHNNLPAEETVRVAARATGAELTGLSTTSVAVKPGASARVPLELRAREAGAVEVTAEAVAAGGADAMKLRIETLPHGLREARAQSGTLEDAALFEPDLPERRVAGADRFRLLLAPALDGVLIDALGWLRGFPYGCVEQTVNRFLPALHAREAFVALGLPEYAKEDALRRDVEQGLIRLYHMQSDDGGFGWWGGGASDPLMTAYALLALEQAAHSGYRVDGARLERCRDRALGLAREIGEPELRAFLLFALALGDRAIGPELNRAFRVRDQLGAFGTAALALAFQADGDAGNGAAVAAGLRAQAKRAGGLTWWTGTRRLPGDLVSGDVEATAWALLALQRSEPDSPLVTEGYRWLLRQRRAGCFSTTRDTAAAVTALAAWAVRQGRTASDARVELEVNGAAARAIEARETVLDPTLFRAGKNQVRLRRSGGGALHYAFDFEYFLPGEDFPSAGTLLKVARRYDRWIPPAREGEERIVPGWSVVRPEDQPRGEWRKSLTRVTPGERFTVVLTVTAGSPLRYLVVEDPLPSGAEVMEREVSGPHSRFERRDERAVFFLDALHGTATLTYNCRAVLPGDFHALPAQASAMYQPEVRGRSAESRVRFGAEEPSETAPPTPDELYFGGTLAARKQQWKDALAMFEALLKSHKLQEAFHDEVLLHQVRGSLLTDRGRAAIAAWEELRGRNPGKAELTTDEKWMLARVYHEQREAERALALYDDLLLGAFQRDRAVAQAYLELNQPQAAQDLLKALLVAYPDFNPVVNEWYQRGMRFTGMRRPAKARKPWLDVEEELMKSEAYGELKAFNAYYPDHPLADDALYQGIRCLADLKLPERAAEEAERFQRRYPKSPWLDETLAIRMESEYVRDRFDAARAAGTALLEGRFPENDAPDAPLKPSAYADQATLLLARIAHLQGDLARAVELYRKVAAKYPDARDSLTFLTARKIEVKPLHVFPAAARDPVVTATVQNVKELAGKVYAVDLAVLFAARKNLKDVHRIDLTGIAPLSTFTAAPPSPAEFRAVETPVPAPVTGPGVFLLVLRGEGVDTSTLVLLTDLAVRVQRVEGGVRVHVEEQGKPARGASVRIGDGSRIVAEGVTDSRGIFEARAEAAAVAVVAEKSGQTAFYQEP